MTQLYAFDLSSKYKLFTHEVKAKKDPVSGDVLIPAYATATPIIAEKDGYARGFIDGQWQYFIDQRGTEYWDEDGTKHTISEVSEEVPESALLEAPEVNEEEPELTNEEKIALYKTYYLSLWDQKLAEKDFDSMATVLLWSQRDGSFYQDAAKELIDWYDGLIQSNYLILSAVSNGIKYDESWADIEPTKEEYLEALPTLSDDEPSNIIAES